ncbi:MAG: hypothetical protein KME16_27080 [Scytolyngbya sp. HA4215-MV1]|nr:hypothetical protein [Scytolyngbya sp. HA4215-MV1]
MVSFDPLHPIHKALQEQHSLLSEKLLELRRDSAIETGAAVQFQIREQIKQVEANLVEIAKQMDNLERVLEDGRLYQALLKLGYRKQVQLFRKFVEKHPVTAFLIYGKLDFGQRWLLNRLVVQHTRDSIAGKVIKVSLGRVARRSDVAALWRELGGRVGLGRQSSVSAIVERVYQSWKTQNVLLVFYDVDFLPERSLKELLQDFWSPLATQVWKGGKPESPYKLLLFLVDYEGCVGNWSIPFAEALNSDWHPRLPVKLPMISEFTKNELTNWLEFSADDLPVALVDDPDAVAQAILENSDNGIPEPTLGEICQQAGLDWYENEEKWMKL